MGYRSGVINAAGVVEASRIGANSDLNVSMNFNAGTATVKLNRRAQRQDASNMYDRLLTLAGATLTTLSGDQLTTLSSASGGFRAYKSYTADAETVEAVSGETEFELECTAYTSGPIEYQLWD